MNQTNTSQNKWPMYRDDWTDMGKHVLLANVFGVSKLIVFVNKDTKNIDTVLDIVSL